MKDFSVKSYRGMKKMVRRGGSAALVVIRAEEVRVMRREMPCTTPPSPGDWPLPMMMINN